MHDCSRARVGNIVSTHGDIIKTWRDRHRKNVAVPGDLKRFDRDDHDSRWTALSSSFLQSGGIGGDLPAVSTLLARPGSADLRRFQNTDPGDPVLGVFSFARLLKSKEKRPFERPTGLSGLVGGAGAECAIMTYLQSLLLLLRSNVLPR